MNVLQTEEYIEFEQIEFEIVLIDVNLRMLYDQTDDVFQKLKIRKRSADDVDGVRYDEKLYVLIRAIRKFIVQSSDELGVIDNVK